MGVIYFLIYVLGSMSLTCLPIFVHQQGRKHNDREKNAAFSEITFMPDFITA